jgi:hyaluronidase-like protein HylP
VSTEPIRAERDERCMDAPRANETRRAMLARAGIAAGALGLLGLADPAHATITRFDDTVEVVPPAGAAGLKLVCSGSVPYSAVTGGALNLDNSASSGAGAVLYSNRGADALGRLLMVNQANPANPQHAVRIQNAGTAHTVSIFHDPAAGAGDPTAEALDIVSTNEQDTALGVRGRETGKGTVKITHGKPAGSDANASALSIALEGAGTACQGIYIGNDANNPTTGDLLHIRNGGPGTDRLRLTAPGRLALPTQGPEGGIAIGNDTTLYRADEQVLATDGALRLAAGGATLSARRWCVAHIPSTATITLNAGAGLRAVAVAAAISTSGVLDPTSLQMFGVSCVVTPSATTNLQAVEMYKSELSVNGIGGTPGGVEGSTFSSFQHRLRLRAIAAGGSGHFTSVFGFYSPPTATVDTGWAVDNYSMLRIEAPAGSGAVFNLTGIDIRDFKSRAANNYSLRSFGPGVHMRHSGGVNLGSQLTPDTLLHLRGNSTFHGSLTLDQESAHPASPAPASQARLYVKNGKLVVQWHDGARTLYTTIPLATPGPYPVSCQVTTDTVAP